MSATSGFSFGTSNSQTSPANSKPGISKPAFSFLSSTVGSPPANSIFRSTAASAETSSLNGTPVSATDDHVAKRAKLDLTQSDHAAAQPKFQTGDYIVYSLSAAVGGNQLLFRVLGHFKGSKLGDYYFNLGSASEHAADSPVLLVGIEQYMRKTKFKIGDKLPFRVGKLEHKDHAEIKSMMMLEGKVVYDVEYCGKTGTVNEEDLD